MHGRGNYILSTNNNEIHLLRNSVIIALKIPLPARLFVIVINILSTFNTGVVTVFKVGKFNRWTILNSVGGLLGLALEIGFHNVINYIKRNLLYSAGAHKLAALSRRTWADCWGPASICLAV